MMIAVLNHRIHLKLRFIAILNFLINNILYVANWLHLLNIIIDLILLLYFFVILVISFVFIIDETSLIHLLIICSPKNIWHMLFHLINIFNLYFVASIQIIAETAIIYLLWTCSGESSCWLDLCILHRH